MTEFDKSDRLVRMLENGKQFTRELVEENQQLRLEQTRLRDEVRELERHLGRTHETSRPDPVEAIKRENNELKQTLEQLRSELKEVENQSKDVSERYLMVEKQNESLMNLYIASQRLHSTLDFDEVVGILKEIVINLIGSEDFEVYIVVGESEKWLRIAGEGDVRETPEGSSQFNAIKQVLQSRSTYVRKADSDTSSDGDDLVACVPLRVGEHVIGAMVVYRLLQQKPELQEIDMELFDLLAERGAVALVSAYLFSSLTKESVEESLQKVAKELASELTAFNAA